MTVQNKKQKADALEEAIRLTNGFCITLVKTDVCKDHTTFHYRVTSSDEMWSMGMRSQAGELLLSEYTDHKDPGVAIL